MKVLKYSYKTDIFHRDRETLSFPKYIAKKNINKLNLETGLTNNAASAASQANIFLKHCQFTFLEYIPNLSAGSL